MPIFTQICQVLAEKKIIKEFICIMTGNTATSRRGLIYGQSMLVFTILLEGHLMIIYAKTTVKSVH